MAFIWSARDRTGCSGTIARIHVGLFTSGRSGAIVDGAVRFVEHCQLHIPVFHAFAWTNIMPPFELRAIHKAKVCISLALQPLFDGFVVSNSDDLPSMLVGDRVEY